MKHIKKFTKHFLTLLLIFLLTVIPITPLPGDAPDPSTDIAIGTEDGDDYEDESDGDVPDAELNAGGPLGGSDDD